MIRPESGSLDAHALTVDPHLHAEKQLGQPGARQHMISGSRYDEPAFAFRQGCKGNDLISGKSVQRRARLKLLDQLLGDMLADRLRASSQGPGLIRPQSYGRSFIGEERQRRPGL